MSASLSTYPKIGRISDPIHGYIEFTSLERSFLDYPIAQRLRNVGQSGLAHYVFPELRTSRFSHCLGTMHLASRMLSSCLRNATPSVTDELAKTLGAVIKRPGSLATIASSPQEDDRVLIAHVYDGESGNRDVWIVVEQAVRLAALFHDLGHLPYSHDFEFALADARDRLPVDDPYLETLTRITPLDASGKRAPHEVLGQGIARLLMRDLIHRHSKRPSGEDSSNSYILQVCELALSILNSSEPWKPNDTLTPQLNVVLWLHSLIDGEVDADRGDFLLRDGRNYGFEFAAYNLDRMLDNLVVSVRDEDKRFITAIRPQGLSTIESYLLSRFRSYQLGVRHHKVAQIGAALRYCIARLLVVRGSFDGLTGELDEFIDSLHVISDPAAENKSEELTPEELRALSIFAKSDDIWWMALMRTALQKLNNPERSNAIDRLPQKIELTSWLSLVCWRARGSKSLWKRTSDFLDLLPSGTGLQSSNAIALWNTLTLDRPNDASDVSRFTELRLSLEEEGVLLLRHKFKPWKAGSTGESERLFLLRDDGTMEAVSGISAIVHALGLAWEQDIQVHAFAIEIWQGDGKVIVSRLTQTLQEEES